MVVPRLFESFNSREPGTLRSGMNLFNAGSFFEAHEVLEEAWREASNPPSRRRHLRGLVQLAVAFHHQSRGNRAGARSVLERAMRNLEGADASYPELDFQSLTDNLQAWRSYLAHTRESTDGASPPPLPSMLLRGHG